MAKKAHPHYNWLLHYNEYKPEEKRFAYFPYEDITGYKTARLIQKLQKLEWSMENPQRNAIKKLTGNIPNKTLEFFFTF